MTTDEPDGGMDWRLLARYLSGELSASERRDVEAWAVEDPSRQEELTTLRRLWQQAGTLPAPSRIDAMWQAVEHEIRAESRAPRPSAIEPGRRFTRLMRGRARLPRAALAVAAALTMAALGVGAWRGMAPAAGGDDIASAPRTYETARGETARFQLADGTRVLLGPDSRLSVAAFAPAGQREAELVGEAVFEVEHDAARPFIVRAGHAVTEDLGTEFGIRAFPGDPDVHVVVLEGRVALRPSGAPAHSGTILEPGQLGRLDAVGRVAVESGADTGDYLGWVDGRVVFQQTPLRDVIVELERWYDVDLQIADSTIAVKRITLDMPAGELYGVLDAVVVPLNLRYERTRNSIRLSR